MINIKLYSKSHCPSAGAAAVLAIGLVLYGLHSRGKRNKMSMSTQGQQPARGIVLLLLYLYMYILTKIYVYIATC
jgi:hypothetical protein